MKSLKRIIKSKLLSSATALRKDNNGNFAIIGAITMGLLVAGLAIAVDISNGWSAKQRLQDTTDAIALLAPVGCTRRN